MATQAPSKSDEVTKIKLAVIVAIVGALATVLGAGMGFLGNYYATKQANKTTLVIEERRERRQELGDQKAARAAARLVLADTRVAGFSLVSAAYQLQTGAPRATIGDVPTGAWKEHREDIALLLDAGDWQKVSDAYVRLDRFQRFHPRQRSFPPRWAGEFELEASLFGVASRVLARYAEVPVGP